MNTIRPLSYTPGDTAGTLEAEITMPWEEIPGVELVVKATAQVQYADGWVTVSHDRADWVHGSIVWSPIPGKPLRFVVNSCRLKILPQSFPVVNYQAIHDAAEKALDRWLENLESENDLEQYAILGNAVRA